METLDVAEIKAIVIGTIKALTEAQELEGLCTREQVVEKILADDAKLEKILNQSTLYAVGWMEMNETTEDQNG